MYRCDAESSELGKVSDGYEAEGISTADKLLRFQTTSTACEEWRESTQQQWYHAVLVVVLRLQTQPLVVLKKWLSVGVRNFWKA